MSSDEQQAEEAGLVLIEDYEGFVKLYRDDENSRRDRVLGLIYVDVKALVEKYNRDGMSPFQCAFSSKDFLNKGKGDQS